MPSFHVIEHTIRRRDTRDGCAWEEFEGEGEGEGELGLFHVRQYLPKGNTSPRTGDVTVICVHAGDFPAELYEPLWEDMLEQMQARKRTIRSIWVADVANQEQSGIINETVLDAEGKGAPCISLTRIPVPR